MKNEIETQYGDSLSIPTVHLNGTSGTELRRQVQEQAKAVRAAIDTLCVNAPHARDYYVVQNGEGDYSHARKQHDARMTKLREIYSELLAISVGIQNQIDLQNRSR
jgi:hypothetical protein